jgi:Protein of unknown function (DUF3110)
MLQLLKVIGLLVIASLSSSVVVVTGFMPSIGRIHQNSGINRNTKDTIRTTDQLTRSTSTTRNSKTLLFVSIQEQEDMLLEQAAQNTAAKPDIIYILMYNPGTDQEGVHSTEYPKDSGSEVMLGFESIEDCIDFSNVLKADNSFPLEPVPTPTPLGQMEAACAGMGLSIMVVPQQQQQ